MANPIAAILSGSMMLDWLGARRECPAARRAAVRIEAAIRSGLAAGELLSPDLGGSQGTTAIGMALERCISH